MLPIAELLSATNNAINKALNEWNIADKVIGFSFDTITTFHQKDDDWNTSKAIYEVFKKEDDNGLPLKNFQ